MLNVVKDACGSGTEISHQSAILTLANRLYDGAVVDSDTACILMTGRPAQAWRCQKPVPIRFEADNLAQIYDRL